MKPMTDTELKELFRKHVPSDRCPAANQTARFASSAFCDFAREVEFVLWRRGMQIASIDPSAAPPTKQTSKPEKPAFLVTVLGWFWG